MAISGGKERPGSRKLRGIGAKDSEASCASPSSLLGGKGGHRAGIKGKAAHH